MTSAPTAATAVVACGALAIHVRQIAARRGLAVDVHPVPPELHNRPERIAPAVEQLLDELAGRYERVVIAYAGCGTRGALDELCSRRGVARLAGDTCYDVFALAEVRTATAEEPGTFFLTDFLVRSFDRVLWRGLGLDRHPDLRDAYFGNYRRVVYLAQRPTPALLAGAERAAGMLGLTLEVIDVSDRGLEQQLAALIEGETTCC
jgi:hypothetical protein